MRRLVARDRILWSVVGSFALLFPISSCPGQVINVPPDPAPPGIGRSVLNLFAGGVIGENFTSSGSIINWYGGTIADRFSMYPDFPPIGDDEDWVPSPTALHIYGESFEIDGVPVSPAQFAMSPDGTVDVPMPSFEFTGTVAGTLSDGVPFMLSAADRVNAGGVIRIEQTPIKLHLLVPPPVGPPTIHVPASIAPQGVRGGQRLFVDPGGVVSDSFNAGRGSRVDVLGGAVGKNFEAYAATVVIESGSVGDEFDVFAGSQVTFNGGVIGKEAQIIDSHFTMNGGVLEDLPVFERSQVRINGGRIGDYFVSSSSTVDIYGGSIGDITGFFGDTTLHGTDFRLNGVPIAGLGSVGSSAMVDLVLGATPPNVLTGTYADGTPFAFTSREEQSNADRFPAGRLRVVQTAAPSGPSMIHVPASPAPLGVHAGQTMIVSPGATLLSNFSAGRGSVVEIDGASVGKNFEASAADVLIKNSTVGQGFDAFPGAQVRFEQSTIGDHFWVYNDAQVQASDSQFTGGIISEGGNLHLQGTKVNGIVDVRTGSQLTVESGTLGDDVLVRSSSHLNVLGGTFLQPVILTFGGTADISGGDFQHQVGVTDGSIKVSGGSFSGDLGRNLGIGDSQATIEGGTIGRFSAEGASSVVVSDGAIGLLSMSINSLAGLDNLSGSTLHISGGDIDRLSLGKTRGTVTGGSINRLTIGGGTIGGNTVLDVFGGEFTGDISVESPAILHLHGREFLLGGLPIAGLSNAGDSVALGTLGAQTLSAILADGSLMMLDPNLTYLASGATLRLTLAVPEPMSVWLVVVGIIGSASLSRKRPY